MENSSSGEHAFTRAPNKTLLGMAVPVLFSLIAEPVTGLADTAFVARLGAESVAALGIGAMAFSAIFWAFNFLGIGTQSEVARFVGSGRNDRAAQLGGQAVLLSLLFGCALLGFMPFLDVVSEALGGSGRVLDLSRDYMTYRLYGAPAVLITTASFGCLRGAQDMRTPLWVATGVNLVNVLLDWVLVFGKGPFPEMGVAGAAIASSASQWIGCIWVLVVMGRKIGFSVTVNPADIRRLFSIGGDLFIRTGMVLLFLSLCTRVANQSGVLEGAAYQAIRQFFIFAALFLDAFAITGQSLVGYFIGARSVSMARKVSAYVCWWSIATGVLLFVAMLAGQDFAAWLLVPPEAAAVFAPAWICVGAIQPLFSLACATDGIHWGSGDFSYLRNAMIIACLVAGPLVLAVQLFQPGEILVWIWGATGVWAGIRGLLGVLRITPGIGRAPLALEQVERS